MMRDLIGQQLGNYRLVKLLGRGGFAEVYLGQHVRLSKQTAAIKVLHAHLSDEQIKAFEQEAETIASLKHLHIVRVLDFDLTNGIPFLVMDYCPHGTLRKRHPKGERIPLSTVVTYVKQVANALQYAHDQKIVHRDVKPENMLLGRRNAILLSDFGIAATAHSTHSMRTQNFAGTAAYMAPEQIKRHPRRESDQYALAVVTYEWLAGSLPFVGTPEEIAIKHLAVEPPSLCQKVPHLSESVEEVVIKALAKDPKERFASIQAFATALEQASQSKPLTPQPNPAPSESTSPSVSTILAPSKKPIQTPRNVDTPAVQSLSQVVASTATSSDSQTRPQPPTSKHPVLKHRPALQLQLTRRRVLVGLTITGVVVAGGGITWFATSSKLAPPMTPTPTPLPLLYTYKGHTGAVTAVAWSPDGKHIASGSSDNTDNTVQVWDATDGGNTFTYKGHSWNVNAVAWSPDGKRIASGSLDKTVQVWDATDGGNVYMYKGHSDWVNAVAWSPDGKRIASGSDDPTVQVWDATDGGNVYMYKEHSDWVNAVAWSPDGKRIASGSRDKTVQVWDAVDGSHVFTYKGHSYGVWAVAWSSDGKRIVSVGDESLENGNDRTVQVWDAVDGSHVFTYKGHSGDVLAVAWSPDGKRIASGSNDKTVQVWVAS